MKKGLHPKMFADAKTTCVSCGSVYTVSSTVQVQQVEICSNCHPVYTGEYRGIMASGRVDRFRKMQADSKKKQEADASKPAKKSRVKKA